MTLANLPAPSFTGADLHARVNAALAEIRPARRFASVAALLADATLAYDAGPRPVAPGDRLQTAEGFLYAVAPAGAATHHLQTAGGVRLTVLPGPDAVALDAFGPAADGATDDRATIQRAYDATPDGGWLRFGKGRRYRINAKLVLDRSVNVDFGGSTVILSNSAFPNNRHFDLLPAIPGLTDGGRLPTTTTWEQAVGAGVRTFAHPNTFAPGDTVALWLGTDPHDPAEGHFVRVCQVTAATAAQFTVDCVTPYAINGTTHRVQRIAAPIRGVTLRDLVIDYVAGTTPDAHAWIGYVSNVHIENIRAAKARILLNLFDSHNVTVRNLSATVERKGQSSHGRLFTGWQLENVLIENVEGDSLDRGAWFFLENWCRGVKVVNAQLIDSDAATTQPVIHVSGGSHDIEFDGLAVSTPAACFLVSNGGTPSDYRLRRLRMLSRPQHVDLSRVESFADVPAGASFMEPGGWARNRVSATVGPNAARTLGLANGVLRRLWVYVESTTGLTGAYLLDSGGGALDITAGLAAGQWREVAAGSDYGTNHPRNSRAHPGKSLQIVTAAGFPANQRVAVVAEFWPVDGSPATFDVASLDSTYAAGDWTPVVQGGGTAGTGTHSVQIGRFTRIGRLVTVSGRVTWTGHTGTGDLRIAGLPFAAANVAANQFAGASFTADLALPTGAVQVVANAVPNATFLNLVATVDNAAFVNVPMDAAGSVAFNVAYTT